MANTRTRTQYRVISKRRGFGPTIKIYGTLKTAQGRVGRLTSDEPWRFWGNAASRLRSPDEFACCNGSECACEGLTLRAEAAAERARYPPLEDAPRIECRTVTTSSWAALAGAEAPRP